MRCSKLSLAAVAGIICLLTSSNYALGQTGWYSLNPQPEPPSMPQGQGGQPSANNPAGMIMLNPQPEPPSMPQGQGGQPSANNPAGFIMLNPQPEPPSRFYPPR